MVIHGTGTDLVPVESAAAHGVTVANLPGINAHSAAEYCAMAMLMLARNIVPITNGLRSLSWDEARRLGAPARELAALTLGIVGVGAIGSRLAKIARNGFGMRVGHQVGAPPGRSRSGTARTCCGKVTSLSSPAR